MVFFQNIPDSQLLSQQATWWANATDEQHRHGDSRPVESRKDEKDSSAATRGLETRMSHHRDDRFCRLLAFDPFSAS